MVAVAVNKLARALGTDPRDVWEVLLERRNGAALRERAEALERGALYAGAKLEFPTIDVSSMPDDVSTLLLLLSRPPAAPAPVLDFGFARTKPELLRPAGDVPQVCFRTTASAAVEAVASTTRLGSPLHRSKKSGASARRGAAAAALVALPVGLVPRPFAMRRAILHAMLGLESDHRCSFDRKVWR